MFNFRRYAILHFNGVAVGAGDNSEDRQAGGLRRTDRALDFYLSHFDASFSHKRFPRGLSVFTIAY